MSDNIRINPGVCCVKDEERGLITFQVEDWKGLIRKAKADGMREAKTIVTDFGTGHADQTAAITREIDRVAMRIEKGEKDKEKLK